MKIKEVFAELFHFFHPPRQQPQRQQGKLRRRQRRLGPELPERGQEPGKAGKLQHRPAQRPQQAVEPQLPAPPPQGEKAQQHSQGQAVAPVPEGSQTAAAAAQRPQQVVEERQPQPQQDGLTEEQKLPGDLDPHPPRSLRSQLPPPSVGSS